MTRWLVIGALMVGACGRSDSSKADPESDPAKAAARVASAWWPADPAEWRAITGDCSKRSEGHESWCAMPSHADIPRLGAFLEERPGLVLALARDPAFGARLDQLMAYLLIGDPERGAGRVGGIASGATGVVTVAMLEAWERPGTTELGIVLRAVLDGANLAESRGTAAIDPVVSALARRSEVSELEVSGGTARIRMGQIVQRAWADAIVREGNRLRVDIAAEGCDRSKEGAEGTLGCRHEVMNASFLKMIADVFGAS